MKPNHIDHQQDQRIEKYVKWVLALLILCGILALCLGCATAAEQEAAYIAHDAATHLLKENPLDLRRQVVHSTIAQTINRIGMPTPKPVVPDWNTPSEVTLLRKEIAAREAERKRVEAARIALEARERTEASVAEIARLKSVEAALKKERNGLLSNARAELAKYEKDKSTLTATMKQATEDSKKDSFEKGLEQGASTLKAIEKESEGIPWLPGIVAGASGILGTIGLAWRKVKKTRREIEKPLEHIVKTIETIDRDDFKKSIKSMFRAEKIPELNAAVERVAGRK